MPIGQPINIHAPGVQAAGTYPNSDVPTIYADGVLNVAPSAQIVKFYLHRISASFSGSNDFQVQPIAEIAMPLGSFLQVAAFFQKNVDDMLSANLIKQADYEAAKKAANS
jgi:hypothetical protein